MIETLLHFIRLAFATSGLWLDTTSTAGRLLLQPTSANAIVIATDSSPGTLVVMDQGRTLVTCSTHREQQTTRIDRCEVKP